MPVSARRSSITASPTALPAATTGGVTSARRSPAPPPPLPGSESAVTSARRSPAPVAPRSARTASPAAAAAAAGSTARSSGTAPAAEAATSSVVLRTPVRVSVVMRLLSEVDTALTGTLAAQAPGSRVPRAVAASASAGTDAEGAALRASPVVAADRDAELVPQPSRADYAPVSLVRYLLSLADVVLRVTPLPTGYSRDVSGRVTSRRVPTYLVGTLGPVPRAGGAGGTGSKARGDGAAVLLPSVAMPLALTSGTAATAVAPWVRELPRATLFRVAADSTLRAVGEPAYVTKF